MTGGSLEARISALQAEIDALRARLAEAEQHTDRTLLRATRLAQIVSALGQVDPSGRVARVAGEVAELFSTDVGLLLLGHDSDLRVAGRWGVTPEDLGDGPYAIPETVATLVARERVVVGPVADLAVLAELDTLAVRHVAWIHLLTRECSVGFLLLARCADMPFTSSDRHELRAVGARVALAIENADLQRRTTEQLEQMRVLHQISAALAGTVDVAEAGRLAAESLCELAPDAAVALYRSVEGGTWVRFAESGPGTLPSRLDGVTPAPGYGDIEVLPLRDGASQVGLIALRGVPVEGLARSLLPHLKDVVGLALGKTLLHEQTAIQARHDALTGLPNRTLLRERITDALSRGISIALIFLDLDRFKVINDSLGHDAGDRLLVEVSGRLRGAVRPTDSVARLGGDEFVVLCERLSTHEQAVDVAERIAAVMAAPFRLERACSLNVTTSQGLVIAGPDATAETLLRDADAAMYVAKARGRNRYEVFHERLRRDATERLRTEQDLQDAVHAGRLRARYLPVMGVAHGRVVGAQALPCYRDGQGRLVPTEEFIEVAEESDLIIVFGNWLIGEACRQMAVWQRELGPDAPNRVLVNISGRQLLRSEFDHVVEQAMADAGILPEALGLKLKESVLVRGGDQACSTLWSLHDKGVSVGMDDFGASHFSFTELKRFPIDVVKIGREFVPGLVGEADDAAIGAAIIQLAKSLHLRSAAAGVETVEQLEALRRLGCDYAQGPVLGRPRTARAITDLIRGGGTRKAMAPIPAG